MIRLSIRRPVAVAMAYLCIAVLGFAAWRNIPIELLPETDLPRLTVRATWPGASPETTEAFLTAPLEGAIQQVRGIEKVTSESFEQYGQGVAQIEVEFARETDMDFARLELSERIAAIEEQLPPAAYRPQVTAYVPSEFQDQRRPFLAYTVTGPFTLEALRTYVDDVLAAEVRQVEGVGAVTADGGRERLLEIELDHERMQALGLSPEVVRQRVADLEIVRQAGRVDVSGVMHTLALRDRATDAAQVRRTPLLTDNGRIVRLDDVAVVRDTYEEPRTYYRIDGQPAVSFSVHKEIGTNAVSVADGVKERLARLDGAHPSGVRLLLDDDESESIRAQLSDLRFRALVAAGVIFMVLLLFLRSWRSAGIVFATIAFSVLITLNLVYWTGHSLNVLTLMGLAMGFGLIVDNAIVVLENVYRHRQRGEGAAVAAERGAAEVVLPVLAATLTTLVVMIPFVYLQGELRVFYVPLAMVVGFSLLASLFVAFTFIPALGSKVLGARRAATDAPSPDPRPPTPDPWYIRLYAGLTGWTLRHPWVTVVLALLVLGGSYRLFDKYVNKGVVWGSWGMGQTYIAVNISLPRGEELARTDELVRDFEARIAAMPEVDRFVSRVYPQYATIRITFPEALEETAVPVAIKEQMVAYSHGFGGAEVRVYGYGPSFYGGGSSPPNYSIQILGYNYDTVREIAEELGNRLLRFSRIQDVDTNASGQWFQRDRATELVLRIDRDRLGMHGLSARDVVMRVRAAVAGGEGRTSVVRLGGEETLFSVKIDGHDRIDALALTELLLPARGGAGVRLGDVATLEEREVQARIRRQDQQYQRTLAYEFRGPTKLGDRVRDVVVESTQLPPGYSLDVRRDWSWSTQEQQQIYGVLAVSLLLVLMVTAALFESVRQPLVVLLTVPMALIGVFLIFFYTGASFTREAYIGVIMMGGIVVNNSILLVDHINALRRRAGMALEAAVLKGTLERVRPILMTTATTVLGLLPLVLFSDYADQNIWNALGFALIGGLTSSTVLVLTVTPAVYLLLERRREAKRVALAVATPALLVALVTACGEAPASAAGAVVTSTDTIDGVVRVTNEGEPPRSEPERFLSLGSAGDLGEPAADEFGYVSSVVADAEGNVYVADRHALEIRVFSPEGEFLRAIGREGAGPGELRDVGMMGWVGDTLAVLDGRNARIGLFSRGGESAGAWRWMPISGSMLFLLRDRDREVLVYTPTPPAGGSGPMGRSYVRYTSAGPADTVPGVDVPESLRSLRCPHPDGQGISFFDVPFTPTFTYAAAPGGLTAVVPGGEYRIAFVDAAGDTARVVERRTAPVAISDTQWEEALLPYREFQRNVPGARCEGEMQRPPAKPATRAVLLDEEGRLWVERHTAEGFAWDVFDPDGALLLTFDAPGRRAGVLPYVRSGRLYQVETDDLGIQRVAGYRIPELAR